MAMGGGVFGLILVEIGVLSLALFLVAAVVGLAYGAYRWFDARERKNRADQTQKPR